MACTALEQDRHDDAQKLDRSSGFYSCFFVPVRRAGGAMKNWPNTTPALVKYALVAIIFSVLAGINAGLIG